MTSRIFPDPDSPTSATASPWSTVIEAPSITTRSSGSPGTSPETEGTRVSEIVMSRISNSGAIPRSEDRIFSVKEVRKLAGAYGVELQVVDGAAHNLMMGPRWEEAAQRSAWQLRASSKTGHLSSKA